MRAYIITTRDKHGRAADLTHYPDSLPEPELYYGVTPDDIETPQWWIEAHKKHKDNVPGNWGLQFLGGWHEFSRAGAYIPHELAPGVLRCYNVLGSEAVIIRGELVTEAIECLTITPEHDYYICDWQLVTMQRRHYAYSPIEMIAKQQSGYSLWENQRDCGEHHHYFVGLDLKTYYI